MYAQMIWAGEESGMVLDENLCLSREDLALITKIREMRAKAEGME